MQEITIGNDGKDNQLLINDGAGNFIVQELPGRSSDTDSVAVADVN